MRNNRGSHCHPPTGTRILRADSNFGTGTARTGPNTWLAKANNSPTRRCRDRHMRATSLGHAGILIEASGRTITCDPWFIPAFHGSWFVFPRNDRLPRHLLDAVERTTYLYISHQHADHLDEAWLSDHLNRDATVLLPDFPTRELEYRLTRLGFHSMIRTRDGEEVDLGDGLRVAIHVETSVTDGPGGDSAIVVSSPTGRLVNQNDCRTGDVGALRQHGPVDLHWLQFSGAIWYPMVYDEEPATLKRLAAAKVESQFARAMRYVESVDSRAVVPSAGPPCFLDPDLFHLNVIDGDEPSIFPDQTAFHRRLAAAKRVGLLTVPGTSVEVTDHGITVTHPNGDDEARRPFDDKRSYLEEYQRDWLPWLESLKATWPSVRTDLVASLKAWWEPLLALAPTLRTAVGDACLIRTDGAEILLDFPTGTVSEHDGRDTGFRLTVPRPLLELVVAEHAVDWSNSLFLSCRFSAWRRGEYNEHFYNFFKSLSPERMRRAEEEAVRRRAPVAPPSDTVRIGRFIVQRQCPHRQADLGEFGILDGDHIVCTLHGWRFRTSDGSCVNADDRRLSVRRAE